MKRVNIFIFLLFVILISPSTALKAQISAVIYVEVSGQSSRAKIINMVDSVLNKTAGERLLFISNGGTPLVFIKSSLGKTELRSLSTLDPSLPNPYFDLDSLITLVHQENILVPDIELHFFLGYENAFKGERHLENIAEKFALSLGLVQNTNAQKVKAFAYFNSGGEPQAELSKKSSKETRSRIYQIKVY